jgi:hypothetical protein
MSTILSKLLEVESLDDIFKPFSSGELYDKIKDKVGDVWVGEWNNDYSKKYCVVSPPGSVDRFISVYYMLGNIASYPMVHIIDGFVGSTSRYLKNIGYDTVKEISFEQMPDVVQREFIQYFGSH